MLVLMNQTIYYFCDDWCLNIGNREESKMSYRSLIMVTKSPLFGPASNLVLSFRAAVFCLVLYSITTTPCSTAMNDGAVRVINYTSLMPSALTFDK